MNTRFFLYGFWSLIFGVTAQLANAQSLARTAYFMENSTHRHLLNPALVPSRGYFSLPVAGEFSLGFESNMQFSNIIYPTATPGGELRTFMHKDIDANEFLSMLEPDNFLRMDLRTSILSMGFYSGTGFWTFDVAARTNMSLNLPYDLFAFAKLGMSNTEGNEYHLDNLSISGGMFTEVSLGYSQNIMNNLRIGGKLKFLGGGAHFKASMDNMDIKMSQDEWSVTTKGQMDVYGKGLALEKDSDETINGVKMGTPGLGGMGMAVDLGLTYSPIRNLDLSIGIVDLGGIKWKKENTLSAESSGQASFTGLSGITADSTNEDKIDDQLNDLKDDLLTMADFKEKAVAGDYFQKLFPTINAGMEYSLLHNKISLGALYTTRLMEDENYSEFTGSLNLRPNKWFNLSGSYSCMHGKKETFGWALGLNPGLINIFIACDYTYLKMNPQFIPLNTLTTNFQLGISIPLARGYLPDKHSF